MAYQIKKMATYRHYYAKHNNLDRIWLNLSVLEIYAKTLLFDPMFNLE